MYDSKLYKAVVSWADNETLWNQWRELITNIDNFDRIKDSDAFYEAHKDDMLKGVKVLWPEKEPYLFLMKEMVETGRRAFMKEKQNEPLGAEDKVFSEFHWYTETAQNGEKGFLIERTNLFVPLNRLRPYGVIDPATGQSKAKKGKLGDFSCILTGYSDDKGRIFVHNDWTRRAAPTFQIETIIENHLMFEYEKFGVETNLYRNLLLPNIITAREAIEKKLGRKIRLPLYDIEQVENKEKRIFSMEPKVTNGWVIFNKNLSQEFKNQLEDFPHGDHDDCPDSLEMLWGVVNNRYKMSPLGIDPTRGR
jgi:predicted phage terminase large subunit-like protein